MKKTFVLNELYVPEGFCCKSTLESRNMFQKAVSKKKYFEKFLTEKFNKIAAEGYKFFDDKVYAHRLFVDNEYTDIATHGVYAFDKTDEKVSYKVYMGPIIKAEELRNGCLKSIGCGSMPGCKPSGAGCNIKSVGCSSKGGDNTQYLNFLNDEKNEDEVKTLNKVFELRKTYVQDFDDYIFSHGEEQEEVSDDIKYNIELIKKAYEEDIREIIASGHGFNKVVEFPADGSGIDEILKQGMLFSSDSKVQLDITPDKENIKTIFLSRFDLWYFPKAKGLIRIIIDLLIKLITFGLYTPKDGTTDYTSRIEDENIKKLEKIYDEDLNAQEETMARNLVNKLLDGGKVPVTVATKTARNGFFGKILDAILGKQYVFETHMVQATKKN